MSSNPEEEDALYDHIVSLSQNLNIELATRLTEIADALAAGQYPAALDVIEIVEQKITTMRSFLLLLP